jgi:hypothetical protein
MKEVVGIAKAKQARFNIHRRIQNAYTGTPNGAA